MFEDQMPGSLRQFNSGEVDLSQLPGVVVAVTEEDCIRPRSAKSDAACRLTTAGPDAGSVGSARSVDQRGDDENAFRDSALPPLGERRENLGRGQGQRRCEERNKQDMASAAWSGQHWTATREESTSSGTTNGRSSSCSAGISRRDGNKSAASRGRADLDMNWRSSCSKLAGNWQDLSLKKANILGRDKVETQASGSRQSEVGWTRQQGAARNVVQAEDRRLDRDSWGFSSVKREAGLLPNEGDNQMDVLCPVSRPSTLIRGASPNSQPENPSLGASVKPVPSSSTFHLADLRKEGMRLAGVGPVPDPRFSRIAERLPLRRPISPAPTLRPGSAVEKKACENASNAEKPMPATSKPVAPVPLAPTLHLTSPTQARAGGDTWQCEKPWPPQGPGHVSSPGWEAASFKPGGSMLPPPASSVQTAPRDANTRSGLRGSEWPTLPPKPAAAETPKASDWNRPLGTGLPGSAHHIGAAATNKEGGPSSFEIRSSRHDVPACPGTSADEVANELREKVNLSVSQSVTRDVPWQYIDNEGYVQGPFKSDQMMEWFLRGFLPMDLMLKRICDVSFNDLGTLIKISKGLPFAPKVSDWNRPLGTGLPGSAHHIGAAETNEEGGPSSLEIRSSRHDVPACPGTSADEVANELKEKVNLSVSQSVTQDVPWQYKIWWLYIDNEGYVQGPFKSDQMMEWFLRGFLPMDLMVKRICDLSFQDLGTLIKISKGLPFDDDICVRIPPQP